MKIKAVSGIVMMVGDPAKSVAFYEQLGFTVVKQEADYATVRSNWFWIEFVAADKAEPTVFKKDHAVQDNVVGGPGAYFHMSVDNVDEYYDELTKLGIKAVNEPKDFPWGRREFIVHDPDGYRLVFFTKK